MTRTEDGQLYIDTEHMGRDFCAKVFEAFGRKLLGQTAGDGKHEGTVISDVSLVKIRGVARMSFGERTFSYVGKGKFKLRWLETYATGTKEKRCTVRWNDGVATTSCDDPLLPAVLKQLALEPALQSDVAG